MKVKFKIFESGFFEGWEQTAVRAAEFATTCEQRLINISQTGNTVCVWYWD